MMAGIDFGLSCVKAYCARRDDEMFLSTADMPRTALAAVLRDAGVHRLQATGHGSTEGFEDFVQARVVGSDPVARGIVVEAEGAVRLLKRMGLALRAGTRLIVSIGTGSTYAVANASGIAPQPGSHVGAGTLDGLLAWAGHTGNEPLDALLGDQEQPSLDLLYGDAMPALRGTEKGACVISHFAGTTHGLPDDPRERTVRAARSAVALLASDLHARLAFMNGLSQFRRMREVVLIGTLVSRSAVARTRLMRAAKTAGWTPVVPDGADFAAAVGAFHATYPRKTEEPS